MLALFIDSEPFNWVRIALLALFVFGSIARVTKLTKMISAAAALAMLLVGAVKGDWSVFIEALNFALIFTIFFPAVLLIRETMARTPETAQAIAAFDDLGPGQRVAGLAVGCHLLSMVLVLGGLIASATFVQAQSDRVLKRELALVTMRGYALIVHWSPFTIGMGYALAFRPDVALIAAMGLGLAITLIGMTLAIAWARGWRGVSAIPIALNSFRAIAGPIAVSVTLIVLLVSFTPLGTIQAVAVAMPVLCWLRLQRLGGAVPYKAVSAAVKKFPDIKEELILFLAAAAIGFSIQAAGLAEALVGWLHLEILGPYAMIALVIVLGPTLAVLGLHPIVAASIVTAFLTPLDGALPDIVEVHLILFVWSCGAFLSFGSLSLSAAARLFDFSLPDLVFSSNLIYVACLGALIFAALSAITALT